MLPPQRAAPQVTRKMTLVRTVRGLASPTGLGPRRSSAPRHRLIEGNSEQRSLDAGKKSAPDGAQLIAQGASAIQKGSSASASVPPDVPCRPACAWQLGRFGPDIEATPVCRPANGRAVGVPHRSMWACQQADATRATLNSPHWCKVVKILVGSK